MNSTGKCPYVLLQISGFLATCTVGNFPSHLTKKVFLPVTQLEKCLSISAEISGGSFCHLHTLKMPRQNDLGLLQTRLENVLTPRQNVPMSRQKHFVLLTTSAHVPVGLPVWDLISSCVDHSVVAGEQWWLSSPPAHFHSSLAGRLRPTGQLHPPPGHAHHRLRGDCWHTGCHRHKDGFRP